STKKQTCAHQTEKEAAMEDSGVLWSSRCNTTRRALQTSGSIRLWIWRALSRGPVLAALLLGAVACDVGTIHGSGSSGDTGGSRGTGRSGDTNGSGDSGGSSGTAGSSGSGSGGAGGTGVTIDVTAPPYNVVCNGSANAQPGIQAALDDAGAAGGGT